MQWVGVEYGRICVLLESQEGGHCSWRCYGGAKMLSLSPTNVYVGVFFRWQCLGVLGPYKLWFREALWLLGSAHKGTGSLYPLLVFLSPNQQWVLFLL